MKNKYILKTIDIVGKGVLFWFVFETLRYFYYGRFMQEIRMVPRLFENGFILTGIYHIFVIPVASIGVFILIPLLLRGHVAGLIIGLLYWIMGYFTNPLWFTFPREMQLTAERKATSLLIAINYTWAAFTLAVIIVFYLYRRHLKKQLFLDAENTT